jgi:uncharacterized membrane protein
MKHLSTKSVAFVGVFAALHVTLYLISPPFLWRNWAIYLAPIEALVLGPWAGFSAALIGSSLGRFVLPTNMWMFGIIAEPLSVLCAGFVIKGKWQPVLAIYAVMFAAYFASPAGRGLPLWPLLDTMIAFCLVYPASKLSKNLFGEKVRLLPVSLVLVSFITVATDAFVRVFLLIPVGLYSSVFGMPTDALYVVFVGGGIDSFIEDLLVIVVSLSVGVPILLALRKVLRLKQAMS